MPAHRDSEADTGAGVRKPRESWGTPVPQALWGFRRDGLGA
jgi:hypothetical protein